MTEGIIVIDHKRIKPVLNQHPWIFSGAVQKAQQAESGQLVTVVSPSGDFLARGYWNHKSQIQVRILTWKDEAIDDDWWGTMLRRAVMGRGLALVRARDGDPAAFRMVNAENDFLPGLVIDYYAGWVVLQALTLYIDLQKTALCEILSRVLKELNIPLKGIYERSDVDVRGKEGLRPAEGLLWGEAPPEQIVIDEMGTRFLVDVQKGHKTGFYLDQRENRLRLLSLIDSELSGPCKLLNLFSYTGGFGIQAMKAGGVHAVHVDSSGEALALAEAAIRLNGLHEKTHGEEYELIRADAFDYLRHCIETNEEYDVVVLDPPKFAQNQQQVDKAARGYKDLNLKAFKIIRSGGYLMTFSCSGTINADLFQKIVFGALVDAGRQAQIIQYLSAASDHPVALTFPEGAYLKGLLLRVY